MGTTPVPTTSANKMKNKNVEKLKVYSFYSTIILN